MGREEGEDGGKEERRINDVKNEGWINCTL